MKIKQVSLYNYRGYRELTTIDFNNLTVFVGRNDIGKSSVLEALDLFFNDGKGIVRFDKTDINISSYDKNYWITVVFSDIPPKVVIDASYKTSLEEEYLLNAEGNFEVCKVFNGNKCTSTTIKANHPTNELCSNLHKKKKSELKAIISNQGIECDNQSINAVMRKAIWNAHLDNLQLKEVDLDVNAGEDTKRIWDKLSNVMPVYSLFQADRQNNDSDKEVQDPLRLAVAQFFQDEELQRTLTAVAEQVEFKLKEVADRTLEKLREMDPSVADSLKPVIPTAKSLKWADVFKNVSITSDDDIPINKRGSGVKRLVLLNFFRAEAERRQDQGESTGIIYAIEEPETSQHFSNQRILADALISLSNTPNTQVIMTTHSGVIVKRLQYKDLRLITTNAAGTKCIAPVEGGLLGYPTLNEVNYIAFGEATEEYHDELYGYIEGHHWLAEYEAGKPRRRYIRVKKNGALVEDPHTLTHYIRDVQHHPENTNNQKYTDADLAQSISDMRVFIKRKKASLEGPAG